MSLTMARSECGHGVLTHANCMEKYIFFNSELVSIIQKTFN